MGRGMIAVMLALAVSGEPPAWLLNMFGDSLLAGILVWLLRSEREHTHEMLQEILKAMTKLVQAFEEHERRRNN